MMKKLSLILIVVALLATAGCRDINEKNLYLPETGNDKTYTTIGGGEEPHQGAGTDTC